MSWSTRRSVSPLAMVKSSGELPGVIGLVGQMAATTAGPEFEEALRPILKAVGPLPHGRLQAAMGASSHSNRRQDLLPADQVRL
jgi:hypothetical protein